MHFVLENEDLTSPMEVPEIPNHGKIRLGKCDRQNHSAPRPPDVCTLIPGTRDSADVRSKILGWGEDQDHPGGPVLLLHKSFNIGLV